MSLSGLFEGGAMMAAQELLAEALHVSGGDEGRSPEGAFLPGAWTPWCESEPPVRPEAVSLQRWLDLNA
jgi:hypothetical protein